MSALSEQGSSTTKEALSEGVALVRDIGAELKSILTSYGPDVAELAIETSRVMAISKSGKTLFFFGVLLVLWNQVYRLSKKAVWSGDCNSSAWFSLSIGFFSVCCTVVFLEDLEVIHFVGIFVPEAYLAAKAIGWI